MTALAVVILAMAVATGAAMAAPVGLLEIRSDRGSVVLPLADFDALTYEYVQSIYAVPVIEEHRRDGGLLRLARVRSPDIKAVEYFRWDGPIREEAGAFVQEAPPYAVDRFVIRVTAPHSQTLRARGWTLDLPANFGETVVTVRPVWLPRALALVATRP